jgi:hypothetical protein
MVVYTNDGANCRSRTGLSENVYIVVVGEVDRVWRGRQVDIWSNLGYQFCRLGYQFGIPILPIGIPIWDTNFPDWFTNLGYQFFRLGYQFGRLGTQFAIEVKKDQGRSWVESI